MRMPDEVHDATLPTVKTVELLTDVVRHPRKVAGSALNIVLLVDQFPLTLGGGERVVLRTASLLQSAGYRVSIVTFQVLCALEALDSARCPVYVLPVSNVFGSGGLRAAWEFGRFLRHERIDIVMTFFESANLFGGLVTKALSRSRLVWNRRDMGILRQPKHRWAYRLLPWLPDHVIAVSEQVRQHAIQVDRIRPARVGVVYNGQDAALFPEPQRDTPPVVITVGNLRPVKGQDVLIEAAALVLKELPTTKFQIVGAILDSEYDQILKMRLAELGIQDHVLFLGGISDPKMLLSRASVFVLPSRSEGFSNSVVEAMLAGLPVVATSVGGNPEAVLDGVTGVIVPPESPEKLAEALLLVLKNPEVAEAMGTRGRSRAKQLFTSQAMLASLSEIFQRLTVRV